MKPSPDALALSLESVPPGELANSLHRKLRDEVIVGRFAAGARMPSTRAMAHELKVSRNTVVDVYERLVVEGFLTTQRGSGTYVSTVLQRPVGSGSPPVEGAAVVVEDPQSRLLPTADRLRGCSANFKPGSPDVSRFPIDEWRRASGRRLRASVFNVGGRDLTQGNAQLRSHIAHYVRHSRAVRCSADAILVTGGAQQAFALLARVLVTRGMTVAVEEPGYPPAIAVFQAAGADIVLVPVDSEGIVVSALPMTAQLVYTTPSHQFPLGVTMSLRRREELLAWAGKADAWIVEDDYDSEYRFAGRRLESLQSMDAQERVIYVGTFSKILLTGLRLGYIAMPAALINDLMMAKWLADRHSPAIAQAVLAEFMESGQFASHLRRMQSLYADRFGLLRTLLGDLPGEVAHLIPAQAGLHMTLLLHESIDPDRLVDEGVANGVGLHALAPFCRQPFANGLVLGFGNIEVRDLERGARWLRRRLIDGPSSDR